MIFYYNGTPYPEYIRNGNACRFIAEVAKEFCKGPIPLTYGSEAETHQASRHQN